MKRCAQLCLSIVLLAPAVEAAEIELTIVRPEPDWLLLPTHLQPCALPSGLRLETCPTQVYPEGVPMEEEESLVAELSPLIAAGDYEAVLARIRMDYPDELALLEAGDTEGFIRERMPTGGPGQGVSFSEPPAPPRLQQSALSPVSRDLRPENSPSRLAERQGRVEPDFISAGLLYVIGQSYVALQRYAPAEAAFHLALVGLPNHVRALEALGILYLQAEHYADARSYLARAVELGRNTAHVHAALGYLELKTYRYWSAGHMFQRALTLDPRNRTALRGLLHALTETGEHAKARALVEQLLRDEPDDPDLWRYRARVALATNDRTAAVASLETALRLGDDSIENRRACAALHLESGNIARAIELLPGAAARGLEFGLVDQALGWLASENRWDEFRTLAASVDRTALGAVEQSRLLTRRASLAMREGNRRAAGTVLQEALALDPLNGDALVALGQIYRADRDLGRADLLFRRASAYGTARGSALMARAEVAVDQGDYEGALTHLRTVATENPASADLRRNIDLLEDLALLSTQR
jgi:tetratricopeptide (TPR) repeat protein